MGAVYFLMRIKSLPTAVSMVLIFASFVISQEKTGKYVPDEVLIKTDSSAEARSHLESLDNEGAKVVEKFAGLGWQRVRIPAGMTVDEAIARYQKRSGFVAVQPNYYYSLLATPNDVDFGAGLLYGLTKISAPQAWDLSTGSSSVVVANIDTGIRYTHQDLAANMWTNPGEANGNGVDDDNNGFIDDYYGWDFRFNDSDPADENGHGTHTSGTIGAVGNNIVGVVGVNWNVKLMAIKIYSPAGEDTTSAMLIAAYQYVLLMKNRGVNIRVTNNSYGGCNEACGYDQATKDAIDALGEAGILNVFAAGNSGTNNDVAPHYPASYTSPTILSVGGSNSADARIYNYGAASVDLAAPAAGIRSTTSTSNSSYGNLSGTSMATPHVTGAAALLSAYNPALSPASLKATLMNTVDVLPQFAGFNRTGGRLNVGRALQNQTVCTFSLSTQTINARTKGGYYSIGVSAGQNCDYAVKSNVNWIKVSGITEGSGNGTVDFRVRLNPGISRTGTLTIAGQTVTVTQSRN
ncbi:MAG TPA: S8 family serine peptidase [Pyrinomonadaceae bacterium]|nr:S8 family serine peptidase [Pyrinomonadaceae bacterium]